MECCGKPRDTVYCPNCGRYLVRTLDRWAEEVRLETLCCGGRDVAELSSDDAGVCITLRDTVTKHIVSVYLDKDEHVSEKGVVTNSISLQVLHFASPEQSAPDELITSLEIWKTCACLQQLCKPIEPSPDGS